MGDDGMISESDLRDILRHKCEAAGNSSKWATANGLNRGSVILSLSGQNRIGPKIAAALGYEKKVVFIACKDKPHSA
jgi:hypothetical protein